MLIYVYGINNSYQHSNFYEVNIMSYTYLTTQQLSEKIHYDSRTIRNQLKDSVLLEGIHYIRPFGGEKFYTFGKLLKRK